AVRERLLRYGTNLKPEIDKRLEGSPGDQERQRLTALRYRLAASQSLALRWPDGFERLASSRQAARHQAVKELESRAAAVDEPLLLELFTSSDAFVREMSLRTLNRGSAKKVSDAFVKLLYDPDPNVRSAVLKQMLDAPSPLLVDKLVKYISW